MTKLIYAGYLLLSTIALVIILQFAWNWIVHRRINASPLIWLLTIVGLFSGIYLWKHHQLYPVVAGDRFQLTESIKGPLRVAAVWPKHDPSFFAGARRAVEEINEAGGVPLVGADGQLRRHDMELVEFPNHAGDDTFRDIAGDRELLAVIGHQDSQEALRASIAYDASGLLYIVPTVTLPTLTDHGQARLIRTIPDDAVIARAMRDVLVQRGISRVALFHVRNLEGEQLGRYISRAITEYSANDARADVPSIVLLRSYPPHQRHFHELITDLLSRRPDAIVVADDLPRAGHLIKQIRERGLSMPILGIPALEGKRLFDITGRYSDDVIVPSLVMPGIDANENRGLAEAQAYDAIHLLAAAWEKTGSVEPAATASMIRGLPQWPGLRGIYDFTPNGDIEGWTLTVKRSQDQKFIPLHGETVKIKEQINASPAPEFGAPNAEMPVPDRVDRAESAPDAQEIPMPEKPASDMPAPDMPAPGMSVPDTPSPEGVPPTFKTPAPAAPAAASNSGG